MLGTIVNVSCILTGSVIGSFVSRGIKEKYKTALFDGLGLATVGLGANAFVSNIPKVCYPVLFIASIAIGTIIGTRLDLDGRFHGLLEKAKGGSKLAEGLSTAILLFASVPCPSWDPLKAASTATTPIFLPTQLWILFLASSCPRPTALASP